MMKNNCGLISVEHACLALAIINAIAMGLALVGSVIMVFVFIVSIQSDGNYFGSTGPNDIDQIFLPGGPVLDIFAGILIAMLALSCLIFFIFAVLLCNGVYNRRPGQVKAYFIFGAVTTTLAVQIFATVLFKSDDLLPGLFGLLGCVIHSLFLVLVYQTYLKLSKEALFKRHVRLLES